jgi:hypothetical protein
MCPGNRSSLRRPTCRLVLLTGLALEAALVLAPAPAAAQATSQQRAVCEDEGRYLCSNYIPDEDQIAACIERNRHLLSPRCRAMLGRGKRPTRTKR